MNPRDLILERWLQCSLTSYPAETSRFLASEEDPFRNPVGYALKENLEVILQVLFGDRDGGDQKGAVEAIVRMRAVQNLTAVQALGFIFQLRQILRDVVPQSDLLSLDRKVDDLAMTAFEAYVRCREQLSELRLNESRRAMELTIARTRECRQ